MNLTQSKRIKQVLLMALVLTGLIGCKSNTKMYMSPQECIDDQIFQGANAYDAGAACDQIYGGAR